MITWEKFRIPLLGFIFGAVLVVLIKVVLATISQ